ncbi:hypothetical protein C5167_034474 [Papaver somniferum]|uniref:Uncharacterized protein n=1 Tax=Papaver somniferum TaxID=3469 RepID=A0A4Y7KEK4_PAPSO|nr:hypothetical protein C5167_034474 [Papaver somniferum]
MFTGFRLGGIVGTGHSAELGLGSVSRYGKRGRIRSVIASNGPVYLCLHPPGRGKSALSTVGAVACRPWSSVLSTVAKRMHWMDARALRRKDAFRGEIPWGDTVCDPWISDRETVSKFCSVSALFGLSNLAN